MKRLLAVIKADPINSIMVAAAATMCAKNIDHMLGSENPIYAVAAGYALFATYMFSYLACQKYKKKNNQK